MLPELLSTIAHSLDPLLGVPEAQRMASPLSVPTPAAWEDAIERAIEAGLLSPAWQAERTACRALWRDLHPDDREGRRHAYLRDLDAHVADPSDAHAHAACALVQDLFADDMLPRHVALADLAVGAVSALPPPWRPRDRADRAVRALGEIGRAQRIRDPPPPPPPPPPPMSSLPPGGRLVPTPAPAGLAPGPAPVAAPVAEAETQASNERGAAVAAAAAAAAGAATAPPQGAVPEVAHAAEPPKVKRGPGRPRKLPGAPKSPYKRRPKPEGETPAPPRKERRKRNTNVLKDEPAAQPDVADPSTHS